MLFEIRCEHDPMVCVVNKRQKVTELELGQMGPKASGFHLSFFMSVHFLMPSNLSWPRHEVSAIAK